MATGFDLTTIAAQLAIPVWLISIIFIWTIIWKGLALWKSARKSHLVWFIIILLFNTLGILEILYIFIFSRLGEKKAKKGKKKSR